MAAVMTISNEVKILRARVAELEADIERGRAWAELLVESDTERETRLLEAEDLADLAMQTGLAECDALRAEVAEREYHIAIFRNALASENKRIRKLEALLESFKQNMPACHNGFGATCRDVETEEWCPMCNMREDIKNALGPEEP